MLILSVIHVPLPQADYHNIRHHHARGEVCVYHDHLLRWHPSAGSNDDVALLHWHWFVPVVEAGGGDPSADNQHRGPGSSPALHAHLADSLEPAWPSEPVIGPDRCGRSLGQLALGFATPGPAHVSSALPFDPNAPRFSGSTLDFAGELRAARTVLFQRWNC